MRVIGRNKDQGYPAPKNNQLEPETGGGLDGLVECGVVHDFK
jgi:hypothetical protein